MTDTTNAASNLVYSHMHTVPSAPTSDAVAPAGPRYVLAYTPNSSGIPHLTTNKTVTLCHHKVVKITDRAPSEAEESVLCEPCRSAWIKGRVSRTFPKTLGSRSARSSAAQAVPAVPADPLEAKATELVRLGGEIADLRAALEAKTTRFQELGTELQQFLARTLLTNAPVPKP